jgi:hypothetical protein
MMYCLEDSKHLSYGKWYMNKDTRLDLICNFRLACHHLYGMMIGIWPDTNKNRFPVVEISLDSRGLGVLLHIAKNNFLLSKLQKFRFYRAKIFSYQDRLEYKRSPELVYLLRTVLTVFQRAETPIHVEAWAGFEAFVTAVRAVDYKPGYVATVASPRVGKRDMMERSWRQLGALESWSLCLDDVTYWGAGNPYLRGPTCGELLHGLVDLIATVTDTVTDLTIRRSHRSHVYCRSCPLDSMFTTYFGSHVFPNLKLLIIQNINLKIEAVLSAFLKKHSSTLK